jgi:hypothetical protein
MCVLSVYMEEAKPEIGINATKEEEKWWWGPSIAVTVMDTIHWLRGCSQKFPDWPTGASKCYSPLPLDAVI